MTGGKVMAWLLFNKTENDYQAVSDKKIKVIFIAGPSSSGKTTFSQKLEDGLKISGRGAIHISMDNYFNDLEDIPIVHGEKDYESINNLDLDLNVWLE